MWLVVGCGVAVGAWFGELWMEGNSSSTAQQRAGGQHDGSGQTGSGEQGTVTMEQTETGQWGAGQYDGEVGFQYNQQQDSSTTSSRIQVQPEAMATQRLIPSSVVQKLCSGERTVAAVRHCLVPSCFLNGYKTQNHALSQQPVVSELASSEQQSTMEVCKATASKSAQRPSSAKSNYLTSPALLPSPSPSLGIYDIPPFYLRLALRD
ncbi:hypothetical protein FPQ18DRAFT_303461 [Pyronema domesticum]|nr:hypothetical protein FPQ18DRAFT_303461 [Pyronema domesticum]